MNNVQNSSRSALAMASRLAIAACMLGVAASSTAQITEAAAPPSSRIITLGTQGGPLFNSKRAQPANAVVVADRIYLVDAGNGVARQLALAGLDARRLQQIFITHNHDDHNADWGTLMGLQWSIGRNTPMQVNGPKGTELMLAAYLRYFEPNAQIRAAEVNYPISPAALFKAHDIEGGGLVFQDDLVKVTAAEVCHYHFNPAKVTPGAQHKAYAYRFEMQDRVVVFSGDTGACGSLVDFARGADILVHEVVSLPLIAEVMRRTFASMQKQPPAGFFDSAMRHMSEDHTTPEDIGKLATAAGVKKVVLSHFVPGGDSDPEAAYLEGVKKYFKGPVVAAQDLMEF